MPITLLARYNEKHQLVGEDDSVIREYSGIFGERYKGQKFLVEISEKNCYHFSSQGRVVVHRCRSHSIGRIIGKREGGETVIYNLEELTPNEENWLIITINAANF
jgi:hypothetical protein